MNKQNFKRTKLACYTTYFTMTSAFCLPALLFATFHSTYGISYTLLGTLVLTNFCTQLTVDLIFTAFSKHFNISKVIKIMPLITSLGLVLYALIPTFFPNFAYIGLLVGTVIFSVSSGLAEVLLSPIIAAIPSDNPQREMSKLHSLYAFGLFTVVTVSTLFLKIFGSEKWVYLTLILALLPIISSVAFFLSPMPDMEKAHPDTNSHSGKKRTVALALCVGSIFFGSCAENAMSNWISGFMENALAIDKALGDILGMAMFAILLGAARIAYAKFGKNILRVLLLSMLGASCCYLVIGFSSGTVLPFVACVLTGLFTAMLWPGSLIMMEEKVPNVGVAAYALMAASGDLGASIAPQLLGVVTDVVSQSSLAEALSLSSGLTLEQIGLKAGMLVISLFPITGTVVVIFAIKYFKKREKNSVSTLC